MLSYHKFDDFDCGLQWCKLLKTGSKIAFSRLPYQSFVKITSPNIYILNYDGNLIDAAAIAALEALHHSKIFKYEIKENNVEIKPGFTELPMNNSPVAITLADIDGKFAVDPWLNEEEVMDSRLTITFVQETTNCFKLLTAFLRKRLHIAIVLDEYHGVAGLISLEDLLETLLGTEIVDEKDQFVDLQDIARKKKPKRKKS